MASQHGVDAHFQAMQEQNRPAAGRIRPVLRMTVVSRLFGVAYVASVGLAVFPTFDLA
ncbi:MAG: hypothetical protein PVJ80_11450 [Gemmatimonadota bacterium]|jgi:hypothetical protein